MKKIIREKKHRLRDEVYIGERPITFTLCIRNRRKIFTEPEIISVFENILFNELKSYDCSSYVYLFMPDHLHMILVGNQSDSNVKGCIEMFKQKTGYWLSQNKIKAKWQKDYYDHILRCEENLTKHIRYILENPVRSEIVDYWKKYPFVGSTVYNLDEWN